MEQIKRYSPVVSEVSYQRTFREFLRQMGLPEDTPLWKVRELLDQCRDSAGTASAAGRLAGVDASRHR